MDGAWQRPPKSLADYGHTEAGRGAEWWGKSVLLTFVLFVRTGHMVDGCAGTWWTLCGEPTSPGSHHALDYERRHEPERRVRCLSQHGSNKRELCRRFGISPQTAYKWLKRYEALAQPRLQEKSRRPASSPKLTQTALEAQAIALRQAHPAWGRRTISGLLEQRIAPSTVTNILHRHGLIQPSLKEHSATLRFEHGAPNDLWQMDFKGHFALQQGLCHPLTLLDDHSRFSLAIEACDNERGATVKGKMIEVFQRYDLPVRINVDNAVP